MEATVFLDRDNTLIANDGDLGDPDAVHLLDGVATGLKALRRTGYGLVVVSNQGGVARGVFSEDDVDAVHQRIAELVDQTAGWGAEDDDQGRHVISRFYYCPYHPKATIDEYRRDHPWRKPHPGMLRQAARDLNLDLARCWMIGDQPRDVEAGRSAGCRTVLLTREAGVAETVKPTVAVRTFPEAVQAILRDTPKRRRSEEPSNPPAAVPEDAAGHSPGQRGGKPAGRSSSGPKRVDEIDRLRRAIDELTESIRDDQQRPVEFTGFRLAAGMCQLFAVLLALLGLLQLGATDTYVKWMLGAVLVQLLTIAVLLMDNRG